MKHVQSSPNAALPAATHWNYVSEPVVLGSPNTHIPQRRGGCAKPSNSVEHGVDPSTSGVRGGASLGRSSASGPDGVSCEPSPSQVGVGLSPSGCGGSGLSKYRLGCLRVLVPLPSFRHDPSASSEDLVLQHSSSCHSPLVPTRALVSSSLPAGGVPSPPLDHPIPGDGRGEGLALVRSLCTLDRPAFLRHVLRSRYSDRIIDTLLAAFRPSSHRQHNLAWRSFQAWLPAQTQTISRVHVIDFLQHLFDTVGLSPRTVLCYRAALKWPLQEAFRVDFDHPDFRRQATGLFHLRPPPSSPIPQWDLNAVLRFYEMVDVTACTLRLAFLKALFLTALASGNRCAELAHFSRRALVDSGSHFTLGVMPRFLYKNQALGRSPPPVSIPLFRANPALCPVVTLRGYLARTALVAHNDFLFVHPTSSASLVAGRMTYWVVQAISAANGCGAVVRAHDVRKFAFSVHWARRANLQHILSYRFWASAHPFLAHYLTSCPSVLPAFVAAGEVV